MATNIGNIVLNVETKTIKADRAVIRVGRLEIEDDGTGFGSVKLDGEPLEGVRRIVLVIQPDQVTRARVDLLTVEQPT